MFNKYGVLKRDSYFDYNSNKLFHEISAHLISDGKELSIIELMALERHYHGMVSGAFADYIVRRQMELKKESED